MRPQVYWVLTSLCSACGTTISDERLVAAEAHFKANAVGKEAFAHVSAAASATVPVYFHVISKDSTTSGGNVPQVYFYIFRFLYSLSYSFLWQSTAILRSPTRSPF